MTITQFSYTSKDIEEFSSCKFPHKIFEIGLEGNEIAVFFWIWGNAIAVNPNNPQPCDASEEEIGIMTTGECRNTIAKCIKALIQRNVLIIERRRGASSLKYLTPPSHWQKIENQKPLSKSKSQSQSQSQSQSKPTIYSSSVLDAQNLGNLPSEVPSELPLPSEESWWRYTGHEFAPGEGRTYSIAVDADLANTIERIVSINKIPKLVAVKRAVEFYYESLHIDKNLPVPPVPLEEMPKEFILHSQLTHF